MGKLKTLEHTYKSKQAARGYWTRSVRREQSTPTLPAHFWD